MADGSSISRGHNRDGSARKRRWRTPSGIFATLNAVYGFGLDAAAEDGAELVPAHITPAMDTLRTPWAALCERNADGERVAWINPPWGPRGDGFPSTSAFTERVAYIDPDTGLPAEAPPGAGCTGFTIWPGSQGRSVVLCDELGNVTCGGVR